MKKDTLKFLYLIFSVCILPAFLLVVILVPKRRKELIWGPAPIISNKYWSDAMKQAGYLSKTLMSNYYGTINTKADYDLYYDDLIPRWIKPRILREALGPFAAFLYISHNASVIHIPFRGGPLGQTPLWRFEGYLLKICGIKSLVMPYGSDAYIYSELPDISLRNVLLTNYPWEGRHEGEIRAKVAYWTKHADIIITGFMTDGIGRWDILLFSHVCIDTHVWQPKTVYSSNDGYNGIVRVMHTPNHRGFKGTEFLLKAVEELKEEGLDIELVLLEKVSNTKVKELMQSVDILAEQFIATAYALNGIEGMASGLPVMANLDNEAYTRVFRRYAYLDECPVLSTTPETIKANLKLLITNPVLREQLGRAGREYVEKYHSEETAQYIFGSVYAKILNKKDVDLINLFHPLKSDYNKRRPYVVHPLSENKFISSDK